jgi:hypothetical protein
VLRPAGIADHAMQSTCLRGNPVDSCDDALFLGRISLNCKKPAWVAFRDCCKFLAWLEKVY